MLVNTLISVFLSEIIVALLFFRLPAQLSTRTDVVGYPTHANYNIDLLYSIYTLQIVAFTVLAVCFYWLISRFRSERLHKAKPLASARVVPGEKAGSLPGMLLTGFILALGACGFPGLISHSFIVHTILIVAGYSALFTSAAWVSSRKGRSWETALSRLNCLAIPYTVFALYGVSRASHIIERDGGITFCSWFPGWLAVPLFALAMGWTLRRLAAAKNESDLAKVERTLLLAVLIPVLIYLLNAFVPRGMDAVQFYHEGESLVPARLMQKGLFPWRDFVFVHGLLQDPFMALVGLKLFQSSIWGAVAGRSLIWSPLYHISHYALALHLFGSNPVFLILTSVLLPVAYAKLAFFNLRFILLPLIFLLLSKTMGSKHRSLGYALGALLAIQIIITQEGAITPIAVLISLVAFEIYHRDRARSWTRQIPKSTALLISASVILTVWLIFLASHGALGAYFTTYTDFGLDYRFGIGTPPTWYIFPEFWLHVVFPAATHFLFCGYFLYLARYRRLDRDAFLMLGMNLFSILYYAKFFAKADGHIDAHVEIALPIMLWLAFRAMNAIELDEHRPAFLVFLQKHLSARPVTLILAGLVFFSSFPAWKSVVRNFPGRFVAQMRGRSRSPQLGYKLSDPGENRVLIDFDALFARHLTPKDRIFDFTEEPALFYYFLDRLPASRYIYANMAPSRKAQRRLVEDLERSRPKLVIYSSRLGYDFIDEVPGAVRHYDVSRYLLDHYHPLADLRHHLVLIRNDGDAIGHAAAFDIPASFAYAPCNWGYVLYFSRLSPGTEEPGAVPLPFSTTATGQTSTTVLRLPKAPMASFHYLDLEWSALRADQFWIGDSGHRVPDPRAWISFKSIDSPEPVRYRVPVGSCIQWRGFKGESLFLDSSLRQNLVSARLVP